MSLLFFDFGSGEILLIVIAVFLIFGPSKIPEMARGLGKFINDIKRASEDIKSEIKAKKVVKSSQEVIEVNIDDVYYSRVKNIYSKIIEFGTLIQSKFTLDPKKMEEVNEIKLACRYMVEAIKYAAELEKNINSCYQSTPK